MMKHYYGLLALFLLALICAACSPVSQEVPTLAAATATRLPASTSTLALTSTPLPTPTAPPTATATLPPTATPTLALPVSLGTPLPETQPITAGNAASLTLLGDYRRVPDGGLRTVLSGNGSTFFTVSGSGIDVYNSDGSEWVRRLEIRVLRPTEERPLWHLLQPSADGSRLMVLRTRGADIYSVEGEKLFTYDTPEGFTWENFAYAFSPDGKKVAVELCSVGCYKPVGFTPDFTVFDVDSGEVLYHWNSGVGGELRGSNPVFSPDGKYLLTYIGGQAFVWDASTWAKVTSITAKVVWYMFPRFAYFSPDGTLVALVGEDGINVWEIANRRLLRTWSGRDFVQSQVMFSPDGSKVGITQWGRLQLRNMADGALLEEIDFQTALISSATLQNDGSVTFFAPPEDDGALSPPWEADLNARSLAFDLLAESNLLRIPGKYAQKACQWQPNGTASCIDTMTASGTDGNIYRLETTDTTVTITAGMQGGEPLVSLPLRQYGAVSEVFAFDPVGMFLFYNARDKASMANLSHGELELIAQWPMTIEALAVSPDHKLVAIDVQASPKRKLLIFDLEQRQMIYDRDFVYGTRGLAFSADSSTLMHLLDQPGREKIQRVTLLRMDDRNRPTYVPIDAPWLALPEIFQFTPDGDLLYSVTNGDLRWMSLPDGEVVASLDVFPNDNFGHPFAISPDGKLLAVFYQGELKVWGIQR
jgi:WD40 repeat protein